MYDVINNLYNLIVSFQMETGNVTDRSNNISVSTGLQNMTDCYGTDQKAIRCNGNIVIVYPPPYKREMWHYQKANIDLIKRAVNAFDWKKVLSNIDVDKMGLHF